MTFQPVRGMRDMREELAVKREFIIDICKIVFENFGFAQWETPALEDYKLLSMKGAGGEAIKDEIYYFKDKKDRELGLRFDLTMAFARIIANNPSMPKPVKRYQIGKVWRYDRPQKMRYREFTQADADIAGSESVLADLECVSIAVEIMRRLELGCTVRINDRELLEEIAIKSCVEKDQIPECFRSIDKLDKIGEKGVEEELKSKKINTEILKVIQKNDLKTAEKVLGKENKTLRKMEGFLEMLENTGYGNEVKFDLSLARGLEYYTGFVFEVMGPDNNSLAAGGRYDNLIQQLGGSKTAAVGISFGIDRILDVMEEKTLAGNFALIYVVPVGEKTVQPALEITSSLRDMGIASEVDIIGRNLSKNIEYANKKGIPYVIVLGEDELRKGEIMLKEMKTGKEKKYSLKELEKLGEQVKGF